jgi:hypothetical protein
VGPAAVQPLLQIRDGGRVADLLEGEDVGAHVEHDRGQMVSFA